jgi:hypothetical protein
MTVSLECIRFKSALIQFWFFPDLISDPLELCASRAAQGLIVKEVFVKVSINKRMPDILG